MKRSVYFVAMAAFACAALAACTSSKSAPLRDGSGLGPAHLPVTPVPDSYRCGDEVFKLAFEEGAAYATLPDNSIVNLPRVGGSAASDPEAPRVFSNGRLTFTQEIEGGRAIRFARGRMAPVQCERLAAQADWKQLSLPVTIVTRQKIMATPAGWLGVIEAAPIEVSGVTLFDGRPEQRVSLAPDVQAQSSDERSLIHIWRLTPASAQGSWIAVSYSKTAAVLTRQLAQGTTEVRVTYDRIIAVAGLPKVTRIEYR